MRARYWLDALSGCSRRNPGDRAPDLRRRPGTGRVLRWPGALVAGVTANFATHPLAWVLLRDAGPAYWPRFLAVESGVWLVEALLVLAYARRDPALIGLAALTANTGSCLVGLGVSLIAR